MGDLVSLAVNFLCWPSFGNFTSIQVFIAKSIFLCHKKVDRAILYFKLLLYYITICNISVINTSMIWSLPSIYFHCLNSNNLALLFGEYQSQWPLFLKNASTEVLRTSHSIFSLPETPYISSVFHPLLHN